MSTTVYVLNYAHRHGVDRLIFEDRADAVAEAYRTMDEYRDEMVAAASTRADAIPIVEAFDALIEKGDLSGATALWIDLLDEDIYIETSDVIPKGGRP
jgi:hypothetical protein